MEILELFGVDWKLLIAQLVNFLIVVGVLWFFALKPLTKTMQKRNDEISKGLSDAKSAEERLEQVEKEVKEKLIATKGDASAILEEAKKLSENTKQENLTKTKEEVAKLIEKAKEQIASEKDSMVNEIKGEVSGMVVTALEKILSQGISKDLDKKYIDKVLKDLK
ncbi:MAG: F0F1 ATP synthase subunit B [Candidatus Komeilibacteria bacterium]|jgi:F-type H+-transporting ATPase subunit b|nr:F0F1 ATP synthase subunit B [Candidatus Komeilibacteria bacterium]MBT4447270.1 F0F1 ATP synthase subunit B [Candidatus Komeilibacteria bacterium]